MSDNNKDYFVPEQLDDDDFEKEKIADKEAKKNKAFEFNRMQVAKIGSILFVVLLIGIGIYLYLNPMQKKSTAPEQFVKEFCSYFNSGKWSKVNSLMDFKGYYVLGAVLEEKDYTEFDSAYKSVDKYDEEYMEFEQSIKQLTSLDDETLKELGNIQIKINSIDACNQIQGTKTLYKLRVNFDYIYNGQAQTGTGSIFVSNASGEYKLVFGEWMQAVLTFYQSAYMQ